MKGIELLRRKQITDQKQLELPPIFNIFFNYYQTGREGLNIKYFKIGSDLIQLTSVSYFGRDDYENTMSHFFDSSTLELEIKKYKNKIDDYHKDGFLMVGQFDINDSVLLGIDEKNKDSIWKLNGDWGEVRPEKEKLAENIFDFVNCFEEVTIKMNLITRKINENLLYKNWHEDFWRVKEDTPVS